MSKHTPGPWEAGRVRHASEDSTCVFDHEVDVYPPSAKPGEYQYPGPVAVVHVNGEVGDADAKLIVAAPDLLTACKAVAELSQALFAGEGLTNAGGARKACAHMFLQKVKDAIAKAEGE